MPRAQPLLRILFFVSCAFAATLSRAENEAPKHYLTFKVGYVGTAHATKGQDPNFKSETKLVFADQFSGMIEVRPSRSAGGVTWAPRGDMVAVEGSISETSTTRSNLTGEGGVHATETKVTRYTGYPAFEANFVNALVTIRADEKLYDIQFMLMPDMATTMEAVLETNEHDIVGAPSLGGGRMRKPSAPQAVPLDMGPSGMNLGFSNYSVAVDVKSEPLQAKAGVLSGTKRIPVPKPAGWNGAWDIGLEVAWTIDVSLPPVELVITAADYATWRPEGSVKKPDEPGNNLVARATLRSKVGGSQLLPEVKSIRFQLLDTSREPGVCLNWPLEAQDGDYDLRLAVVSEGTLGKADQILEVAKPKKNEDGQPYAETRIDSYDFGGRASLRAICVLADGREIEGVMKGVGEMPRLPAMKAPGWVADHWRQAHHAGQLADDDDAEKVEGQKDNGDGFTLYEEYRGWVMNGERVEGDPTKKDFFVLNLIGGDAQAGIDLFEQLSQLRVHSKLLPAEMSEEKRLMNGNHRDAPFRVAQHGVWVKVFASKSELGDEGADTPMTQAGVAGRPGITKGVGLLARNNADSAFNQSFNLPPADAAFTFDRAIAHELLHSVGVEHHGGKGDYKTDLFLIVPEHPRSRLSVAYYTESLDSCIPVRVLDEAGQDLAAKQMSEFGWIIKQAHVDLLSGYLDKARKDFARDASYKQASKYASPEVQADVEFYNVQAATYAIKEALVGIKGGAHSGDEACVMRYYFAKLYEGEAGVEKTYYKVTPGTERIGRQICRSGKGTGANAHVRKPVPRYGDAAGDAGNCFEQICPNDAIPPRAVSE